MTIAKISEPYPIPGTPNFGVTVTEENQLVFGSLEQAERFIDHMDQMMRRVKEMEAELERQRACK